MRPLLKLALWTGSLGTAAMVMQRVLRRRRMQIDVGAVSDEWLAHRRGVADESPY
jgi:hypothetical protein